VRVSRVAQDMTSVIGLSGLTGFQSQKDCYEEVVVRIERVVRVVVLFRLEGDVRAEGPVSVQSCEWQGGIIIKAGCVDCVN